MRNLSLCFVAAQLAVCGLCHARDWPNFRGPFYNGSTDEENLPAKWSLTENIAWVAELPGPSAATPVISGDHIFVASTDTDASGLAAVCVNRKNGKVIWQHPVPGEVQRDDRSNFASCSPATDGEIAVFFYGNGELIAYDFEGNKVWRRNIQEDYGEFAFLWTFSTSPIIHGGKLFLQVLQRDTPVDGRGFKDRVNESYLLAMDPKTGKTLWRHVRPSKAVWESREAFTTPIPFKFHGENALLVVGGDALTAHDFETGKELWRWGTWNPKRIKSWRHVPSPVLGNDIVLVCAPKRDPIYAIRVGRKGRLSQDDIVWVSRETRELSSDVPTPAYYDGDFFVLSDLRDTLLRVEPESGKVKWKIDTPGFPKYEASPLAADGKIYIINVDADVVVVDAESGKILSNISMKDSDGYLVRSSIVASQGQLFVRTNTKLFCIGK